MMLMPQMMPTGPNGLKLVAGQEGDPEWEQISETGFVYGYLGSLAPTTGGAIAGIIVTGISHFVQRTAIGWPAGESALNLELTGTSPPPNSGWVSLKIYNAAGTLIGTYNRVDADYSVYGNSAYFTWPDAVPTASGPFVNGQTYFIEFV